MKKILSLPKRIIKKAIKGVVSLLPFRYKWEKEYVKYRIDHKYAMKKRFYQEFSNLYEQSSDVQSFDKKKLWKDCWRCWNRYGAEPEDYFYMNFFHITDRERNYHVTRDRLNFIKPLLNDENLVAVLDNKILFNKHFSPYLRREWCDPLQCTEEEFVAKFSTKNRRIDRLIIKESTGRGGHGIYVWDVRTTEDLTELYRKIHTENKSVVVEEYIHQKGYLHELNPSSLNTLRIATIRGAKEIIPLFGYMRCGVGDSIVDNLHSGGISCQIDVKTGTIFAGRTHECSDVKEHPISHLQIAGYTISEWDKLREFCQKAHESAPEGLRLIGWDMCLSDGHISLIEGNAGPGFPHITHPSDNQWDRVKQILNELEESGKIFPKKKK